MSLHPLAVYLVPEDTARVAHAAFPKGNSYLALRDELGAIFEDRAFAALFAACGRSAIAPAQLALVTILQFAEGLSDLQAADAVRARSDWKYPLSLELDDAGFDASVLCEFRARLLAGEQETLLLDTLLALCRERGLLKARGRQRTDSTHVLAAVRALNRLELVGEAMRHALNSLAVAAPAWLRAQAAPDWADRYARRAEDDLSWLAATSVRESRGIRASAGAAGPRRRLATAAATARDQRHGRRPPEPALGSRHTRKEPPMFTRCLRRVARTGRAGWRALHRRLVAATKPTAATVLAENPFLRQQLVVLTRGVKRPRCTPADRAVLVLLASRVRRWRQALLLRAIAC